MKSDYVDDVLYCISRRRNVLIHGSGGNGKSVTLKHLARILLQKNVPFALTALTGVAAVSLHSQEVVAKTLHSWAGVGLADKSPDVLLSKIRKDRRSESRWKTIVVLIVDEVSMMGRELLEKLDYIARNIRKSSHAFGGITLVLSGDFLQLCPVRQEWCFTSPIWEEMKLVPILLTFPLRFTDRAYANLLSRVRTGSQTQADIDVLMSRVNLDFDQAPGSVLPTIMHSRVVDVEAANMTELEKLPGNHFSFIARDHFVLKKRDARYDVYSRMLDDACPKELVFKKNAQVMLRINYDVEEGLVNGSRAVITDLNDDLITVKFDNGREYMFGAYTWRFEDEDAIAVRSQMPFILAFASSIHKTQGISLSKAICDLGASIFTCGQSYVALSRVRSLNGLYLSALHPSKIIVDQQALGYIKSLDVLEILRLNNEKELDFEWPKDINKTIVREIWKRKIPSLICCLPKELLHLLVEIVE